MLSGRLVHLIESHQEEITTSVMREMRRHPDLAHFHRLPDAELRERAQLILENLGKWLSASYEAEIEQRYQALGRMRFEEGIPLHECVRALSIIKNKMLDFVHERQLNRTSLELYAEEELERRVGHFFDALTIHMVRGYETAWHRAAHAVA